MERVIAGPERKGRVMNEKTKHTIAAYREVARRVAAHRPDLIVITSPHAPLYRDCLLYTS